VIVPDEAAKSALAKLAGSERPRRPSSAQTQPYMVQIHPKGRIVSSPTATYVVEEKRFGNQFAVLETDVLYQGNIGLLCEEAAYLRREDSII
jgi:hypothetical protein